MRTTILNLVLLCFLAAPLHAAEAPSYAGELSREAMFKQLTALAGTDNAEIKYNLGMFYNNGIGTPRDNKAAFRYFSEAAEAGNLLASYKVGCYYAGQFPDVVPSDAQAAFKYKLRAADGGYDLAQHDVALSFAKRGDLTNALTWWEKASRQGYMPATAYLAHYLSGVDSHDKVKGLATMLVLREQMRDVPEELSGRLAGVQTALSEDEKRQAERIKASWLTGPTPITTAARAGVSAVPALLRSLKQ